MRAHLAPQVRAYTKAGAYDFQEIVGLRDTEDDDAIPPSEHTYGWKPIWLKVGARHKPVYIHLTGFTFEELEAFEKVVKHAIEDAKVIVEDLDKQALEVLVSGAKDVPLRALSSAPPYFEREIELRYEANPQDRVLEARDHLYEDASANPAF